MTANSMRKAIEDRYKALEVRREAMIERVRALDESRRDLKPEQGFSPVGVIEHIALMEEFNVGFLDLLPPERLSGEKTVIRVLGKMVFKGLSDPTKYMGRTLPAAIPKGTTGIETATVHWTSVRTRLWNHFQSVSDPDAAFIKMDWLFGTLSANQYLDLVEAHMRYHEVRFPK